MCCEVLKPSFILVVNGEEVVGRVDYVGECRGLVQSVFQVMVYVVAKYCCRVGCERCRKVCRLVLEFSLSGVVGVKCVSV